MLFVSACDSGGTAEALDRSLEHAAPDLSHSDAVAIAHTFGENDGDLQGLPKLLNRMRPVIPLSTYKLDLGLEADRSGVDDNTLETAICNGVLGALMPTTSFNLQNGTVEVSGNAETPSDLVKKIVISVAEHFFSAQDQRIFTFESGLDDLLSNHVLDTNLPPTNPQQLAIWVQLQELETSC